MKRLVSAFLAGAMALSLAACGGAASTSTVASSASASGSAAASETAASDLDYIKEKGKMVIGYTVYEPMNYTDADGNFTGFDTELATAVCEKLGVEPEFVEINWDTKVVELDAKSIDCIWNGMTLTDDIMANTATTKAYAKNAQVVVVKDGTDYSSTADLVGKTVVAEAGSAGEAAIEGDENLAQADYVSKSVQTDCLMEVAAGTADAAVLDLTLANAMIGEGTDYASLKIVDELNAEEYGVAFRKGSDAAAVDLGEVAGVIDGKSHHRCHHASAGAGGPRVIHAQQAGAKVDHDDLQHQRRTADDPHESFHRAGKRLAPAHGAESDHQTQRQRKQQGQCKQFTVEQKCAGKAPQNHRHKNTPINPFLTKGTPRSGGAPIILNVNA